MSSDDSQTSLPPSEFSRPREMEQNLNDLTEQIIVRRDEADESASSSDSMDICDENTITGEPVHAEIVQSAPEEAAHAVRDQRRTANFSNHQREPATDARAITFYSPHMQSPAQSFLQKQNASPSRPHLFYNTNLPAAQPQPYSPRKEPDGLLLRSQALNLSSLKQRFTEMFTKPPHTQVHSNRPLSQSHSPPVFKGQAATSRMLRRQLSHHSSGSSCCS